MPTFINETFLTTQRTAIAGQRPEHFCAPFQGFQRLPQYDPHHRRCYLLHHGKAIQTMKKLDQQRHHCHL